MTTYASWVRFTPDRLPTETRVQHVPAAEAPEMHEAEPVQRDGSLFLDWGLPIPDLYHQNYLRLMVQDPYRLFAYWELSDFLNERFFPPGTPADRRNHLVLLLHDLHDVSKIPLSVGAAREWWLHVRPGKMYRTTLEVRYPDGRMETLLSSNEVTTPRDTVSWPLESTDLLNEENMRYLKLLSFSGADPVDHDFLEMLRQCERFDRVFTVPEFLLRYLPDWLREVIRRLQFRVPHSIFVEFVLERYFPAFLHGRILDSPGLTAETFEELLRGHVRTDAGSLVFHLPRVHSGAGRLHLLPSDPECGRTP